MKKNVQCAFLERGRLPKTPSKGPDPSRAVSENVTKQKLMKTMRAWGGFIFQISSAPEKSSKVRRTIVETILHIFLNMFKHL